MLPAGLTVESADSYGSSAWSVTARITAHTSDGSVERFFLKVRFWFSYVTSLMIGYADYETGL